MFLSVPGSRNVTFSLKSHFFALLRLWRAKVTFCAKVTFGSKSGFWEEFPLDLALFLKPLERSAPSVISDDEKTAFAEKFTKIMWNFIKFHKFHFSKVQTRFPTSALLRMTVSSRASDVVGHPFSAEVRKVWNFHFFHFWSLIHPKGRVFRFWRPESDFSRPGSQTCLWAMVS